MEEPRETREGTENIKPRGGSLSLRQLRPPTDQKFVPKTPPVVMCEMDLGKVWACEGYHSNLSRRGCSEVSVSRPCQLVYT